MASRRYRPRPSDTEMLRWIEQQRRTTGFPPSRRELAEHFDVSLDSVQRTIYDMVDDGLLEVRPGGARSINITGAGMKIITEDMT